MDSPQDSGPPIEGEALFYTSAEPLDNVLHRDLGIYDTFKPYGFAAEAQAIPVMVTEFVPAAVNYPIIFVGEHFTPVIATAFDVGQNLFVQPDGAYLTGAYIPMYMRRYPFALAEDPQNQRMVVCIERQSPLIAEEAERKLFNADGEPTDFTKDCIQFCTLVEEDKQRTANFVNYLKTFELLELRQINQNTPQPDGTEESELRGAFWAVSEAALRALSPEKLAELRDTGALLPIYAHIASQANWDKMMALHMERESHAPAKVSVQ